MAKSEHSKNIVTDDIETEQFGKLAKAKIPRVSIDMDGFRIAQYATSENSEINEEKRGCEEEKFDMSIMKAFRDQRVVKR